MHSSWSNDPLAEGNLWLEKRDTKRRVRPPTTARTAARGQHVLSQMDINHGMGIHNIQNEKIASIAGKPFGAVTNSKYQKDTMLINHFPPNATTGPIVSIRVFGFEGFFGLDRLVPDLRDVQHTVWVTVCLGEYFCFTMGKTSCLTLRETPCQLKSSYEGGSYHGGQNDYRPAFFISTSNYGKNDRDPAKDPRIPGKIP